MPIKDNYFEKSWEFFSEREFIFMNIHPSKIEIAVYEILRVSR